MNAKEKRKESLMPQGIPRYIRCYDNGGKTLDRYTVIFTGRYTHKTGGMFWDVLMNAAPYQGICVHGESRTPIDKPSYKHLGKKIIFEELPADCQRVVINDYKSLWDISN